VLLVEDEESIADAVAAGLQQAGYQTRTLPDGRGIEAVIDAFRPDLAVVDVMLPGPRDGFALTRLLRGDRNVAVILLTARDGLADRLRGFESGADDYVVKPFAAAELIARVGAVLRRLGRVPSTVQVGDLVLDEAAGVAVRDGQPLSLTPTELRVLSYLVTHRGRTLSKTQILTQVWGYEDFDANLVEVHMSSLRRKVEAFGPRMIHTERGLGYVLRA